MFKQGGTVTAGNASGRNDGAAALVMMAEEEAFSRGLSPRLRFIAQAAAGVSPEIMGIGPVPAVMKALKLAGLTLDDIDLIELNEAFAAQALAVVKELNIDKSKLNVNGGAIALGHPIGGTGAILTVKIMNELERRGGRYGLITACIGGGQVSQRSLKICEYKVLEGMLHGHTASFANTSDVSHRRRKASA